MLRAWPVRLRQTGVAGRATRPYPESAARVVTGNPARRWMAAGEGQLVRAPPPGELESRLATRSSSSGELKK
jgi:hypothetical protein